MVYFELRFACSGYGIGRPHPRYHSVKLYISHGGVYRHFLHTSLLTLCRLCTFLDKARQGCVMGVGMCLYTQLVQKKNKQCKSAIILQCYHPHLSDFCSRPRLTQPYFSYNISWCCQNLSSLLLKVSVDCCIC